MSVPALEELREAWERHQAIPWEERLFDEPPDVKVPRRCRGCGRELPAFVVGWGEIQWAVTHNEPLPGSLDPWACRFCEEKDDDDD